jgi:outer membrane receptor protein involved in Fe transport
VPAYPSCSLQFLLGGAVAAFIASPALAADQGAPAPVAAEEPIEEVLIFGRAEQLIGVAPAASEGAVAGADLDVRPILRVAELLEAVPGLIAAQHSGSGKANQYFLRGFNLDHGTDFTTYIDDVPLNLRSQGHGQGYLDVNGLIPEVIERIDYRKGPYRADIGDFGLAGAAFMTTSVRFDRPFAQAEVGDYGWYRAATGGTFDVGPGELMLAGQWKTYDGPWQQPEDLQHLSAYGKYSFVSSLGVLDASLSIYDATWRPTEQIPERAIGTSICPDEFCAIDPTAFGTTTRVIGAAHIDSEAGNALVRGTVYGQYYDWHMSSNPTFFLDDPVNGDQIDQADRRWIWGGRLEVSEQLFPNLEGKLGLEGRYDDVRKIALFDSVAGQRVGVISAHSIGEGSAAAYAEVTWNPIERLRLFGGLRGDYYDFDVTALDGTSTTGSADDSILSPKLAIAYQATDYLEFYGNWGRGFHSNDARGVIDPASPVPGLVAGEGKEVGARLQVGDFTVTGTYWWLDIDSELIFVGDSNSVEPKQGSNREGYELVLFWRPVDWLAIDAVWVGNHARFVNSPGAEFIPGAVENAGELGISAIFDQWDASIRVRHLGEYPMVEDNSLRSEAETLVNFRAAWKPGRFSVYAEVLNVFDHHGKDIRYFYTSRLPGEPLGGVDGFLSRAEEPRTLRVGLKVEL